MPQNPSNAPCWRGFTLRFLGIGTVALACLADEHMKHAAIVEAEDKACRVSEHRCLVRALHDDREGVFQQGAAFFGVILRREQINEELGYFAFVHGYASSIMSTRMKGRGYQWISLSTSIPAMEMALSSENEK